MFLDPEHSIEQSQGSGHWHELSVHQTESPKEIGSEKKKGWMSRVFKKEENGEASVENGRKGLKGWFGRKKGAQ